MNLIIYLIYFREQLLFIKKFRENLFLKWVCYSSCTQYRGVATRGGGFTGGTNLGTAGFQSNVRTHSVDADFPEIDSIKFTIQIVNNETDMERLHFANIIERQTRVWRESKIESLIAQRNKIDKEIQNLRSGTIRSRGMSKISNSFQEQESHLI